MVSSRDRLLTAATTEFAARGFDGARIDRIAARAAVNKAMIYYHFRSKAGLYDAVLLDLFRGVADAAEAVARQDDDPDVRLCRFVEVIAERAVARPHFPPIWLREMAEAGRHIGPPIVAQMARIIAVLDGILRAGRRDGRFRNVPAIVVHVGIVAPLLMFAASGPVRARFAGLIAAPVDGVAPDAVVRHVQQVTLASLRPEAASRTPGSRARTRTRSRR